jgi:hypothetical protein
MTEEECTNQLNERLLKLRIFPFVMGDSPTNHKYQQICTYIDSPMFIHGVETIRKSLNIVVTPPNPEEIYNLLSFQTKYSSWSKENAEVAKELETKAHQMSSFMNRREPFPGLTIQAIFSGVVVYEHKLWTTYKDMGYLQQNYPVIIISEETTKNDVLSAWKDAVQWHKRNNSKLRLDEPPYKPKVENYYEWYWSRMKGKKYSQIANEWVEKNPDDGMVTEDDVIKGVQAYRSLLVQ